MTIYNVTVPGAWRIQHYTPPSVTSGSGPWRSLYRDKPEKLRGRKPKGALLRPKPYFFRELVSRYLDADIMLYKDGQLIGRRTGVWKSASAVETQPFYTKGESLAIIKALTKLKNQKVNLGVAMVEAKSTARMLGDGLERIAKAYMRMKKLDPKGAIRALRYQPGKAVRRTLIGANRGGGRAASGIPQAWLEVQYGLLPLMSDMDGAVQELLGRDRSLFRITVKGEHTETKFVQYVSNEWGASFTVDRLDTHRNAVSLSYAPKNGAMIAAARVGSLNALEVAWEWTPFSFLLDWVVPVGDWLHVLDAAAGWDFLFGSHTSFLRSHAVQTPVKDTPGQPGYVYVVPDRRSVFSEAVTFDRKTYSLSPFPSFPPPKNPLSLGHLANGLALLATVFGGTSRPPMYNY